MTRENGVFVRGINRVSFAVRSSLAILCFCNGALAETAPNWRWAETFESPNNYNWAMAVDPVGNVYLSGAFRDRFNFGNIAFTGEGMFLVKCGRTGNPIWAVREGAFSSVGFGLGLDGAGNIYALCDLSVSGQWGIPLAGNTVTGRVALIKYDAGGQAIWAKVLVKQASSPGHVSSVPSVDEIGNSYWSFRLSGAVTFATTNVTLPQNSGAIVKCDAHGELSWIRFLTGTSQPGLHVIVSCLDPFGNLFVSGWFQGGVSLGATNLTTAERQSTFLAKYNADGDLLWVKQPAGSVATTTLAADAVGNCFLGVQYTGVVGFASVTLTNNTANNFFGLIKCDGSGNAIWARQVAETSTSALAVDSEGNSYVAPGNGLSTALYAKYDPEGMIAWSKPGTPGSVWLLQSDALGNCYAFGKFQPQDSIVLSGINADTFVLAKLDTTTLPALKIGTTYTSVAISWPVLADGFYLESRSDLGSDWTSNSASLQIVGALNQVILPATNQSAFFRLRRD